MEIYFPMELTCLQSTFLAILNLHTFSVVQPSGGFFRYLIFVNLSLAKHTSALCHWSLCFLSAVSNFLNVQEGHSQNFNKKYII